jgi:hypothetical protein
MTNAQGREWLLTDTEAYARLKPETGLPVSIIHSVLELLEHSFDLGDEARSEVERLLDDKTEVMCDRSLLLSAALFISLAIRLLAVLIGRKFF